MYKIDTFMEYWMIVEDRLVVTNDVTLKQIKAMVKEMESIDAEYTVVFEVDAFASYRKMPECIANHIKNMNIGDTCGFGDVEIRKVSNHLCVGVMLNVLYQYNDLKLVDAHDQFDDELTQLVEAAEEHPQTAKLLELQLCG